MRIARGPVVLLFGLATPAAVAAQQPNPERNAYFGETHLHTSWSVDAWVMGNRMTGPGEALKYAQGQTIKHPLGYNITIDTPLDFMGVTDHSEYVGVTREANTPGSYVSKLPEAQPMIMKDPSSTAEQNRVFSYLLSLTNGPPVKAFMDPKVTETVWKENVKLANENNHPGKFTAFCSYEWTSMPGQRNLHRNIFFRACDHVPDYPFSSLNSSLPTDLWAWMDGQRKAGNELLAISHNANVSDGWMYPVDVDYATGRPIDAAWAAARDRNERLVEIKQGKGQSETHPLLSPNDEFASYELYEAILGLPADSGRIDRIAGSYGRQALKDGITLQDIRGYNPYKFGMAGGSDAHNSASPYRQDNFFGLHADADGTVQRRFAGVLIGGTMDTRLENPGGLTGVWAEENTRASIWDAMYRKETFGVSGPHIKVRFFGGWGYGRGLMTAKDWVRQSYATGVPMGGDLLHALRGRERPRISWCGRSRIRHPATSIASRSSRGGPATARVSSASMTSPGPATARPTSGPAGCRRSRARSTWTRPPIPTLWAPPKLKAVWVDPEFDPSLHAFYYVRVLEIPTPRWTLIQAVKSGLPPPDIVPLTGQERAWTSPIWYTPSAQARKSAPAGLKVADLQRRGAKALTDAQLKSLIVGKALWYRNTVTEDQFSQNYTREGQSITFRVGFNADMPSGFGNVARRGYEGVAAAYRIEGGKLVMPVSQDEYSMTFYRLGDTLYAARSNEFGFANYQVIAAPQFAVNPLTEAINHLAADLGLTAEQKQQMVPIVKQEVAKLEALKKDSSLSALQRVERLRQVSKSFDAQMTPLLNAAQRAKFEAARDAMRRRILQQVADSAAGKFRQID